MPKKKTRNQRAEFSDKRPLIFHIRERGGNPTIPNSSRSSNLQETQAQKALFCSSMAETETHRALRNQRFKGRRNESPNRIQNRHPPPRQPSVRCG
ncbi:unnamed protein product [Cuscuta campestris]|uniref:Uncharacterized protein n=1 Tax=Cuscuta campestris TaxID=132261 RepID=A0A484NM06_9ASTE|nr:unnamed protein product [Cuscuta campestris]